MTFHLFFASPEKVLFDEDVISVIIPGRAGVFETLKDHAPIISRLDAGKIEITKIDKEKIFWNISSGYFEMSHNQASLLVESAESGRDE